MMQRIQHSATGKLRRMIFGAVIVLITIWMHGSDLLTPPAGRHTWAQADHYALAKGFSENNLDFFHPQTTVYNHQFPNEWKTADKSNITAVDFPVHNYIPGVIMKISGSDSPAIYKLYMLLLSFTGLFYLFRIALLFNKSETLSFFIVLAVSCLPVLTFYQIRFIPSIPSLSTAFIGMYYYFSYRSSGKFKTLFTAVLFLTLSALTRTTFLIPLFAVFGAELFRLFKDKSQLSGKIILAACSVGLIGGYMLYNGYLRREYGSLFLNLLMPARSFEEFVALTKITYLNWKTEYFSTWHYVAAVILLFVSYVRRKDKRIVREVNYTFLFVLLFTGAAAFYVAMCRQFTDHDYYFSDTFYLPVILLVCSLSRFLRYESAVARIEGIIIAVALSCGMIYANYHSQQLRESSEKWGWNELTEHDYKNSDKLADRLGIPKDEKLLILNPVSPNIPLMKMNRKGYVGRSDSKEFLQIMMKFPVNYIVFQNELFLPNIYNHYPEIIRELEIIGTNGRITICRKTAPKEKTLFQFLQLDRKQPVFETAFDDTTQQAWECVRRFNELEKAWEFTDQDEFGVVLKLRDSSWFSKERILLFEGEVKWSMTEDIDFFASFAEKGELKMYKIYSLRDSRTSDGEWGKFRFLINVPASTANPRELSAGFQNGQKAHFFLRKIRCKLF